MGLLITDPVFSSADGSTVDCNIQEEGSKVINPFTASIDDTEKYGRDLYQDLIDGKYGLISAFVPLEIKPIRPQPITRGTQSL